MDAPKYHVDLKALPTLMAQERERFSVEHPKSRQLFARAQGSLLGGVPMMWMLFWPGEFPMYAKHARGARVVDVDGLEYVDFCLGDTGAMTGHSPAAVIEAVRRQMEHGITTLLPTEDAIWVGEELQRRFSLPFGISRSRPQTLTASPSRFAGR